MRLRLVLPTQPVWLQAVCDGQKRRGTVLRTGHRGCIRLSLRNARQGVFKDLSGDLHRADLAASAADLIG